MLLDLSRHSKAETQNMASSYDDTWDDSALIDSWNEALEEYKVELRQVLTSFYSLSTVTALP